MVEAIKNELHLQKDFLAGQSLQTIYFGGGTPSLLHENELEQLLTQIQKYFTVESNAEITLEANPDDLDREKLATIKSMGINRLSIGIQSFNDQRLRYLNRIHNGKEAVEVVENARKAGFENLNCDLIYGIPAPDHQQWEQDLMNMIKLAPNHISAYCLTIEPGTYFGRMVERNKIKEADEEFAAGEYEILVQQLENAGFQHYEISNFARPGQLSRHNTSYWQGKPYLGVGPGAHSFNGNTRFFNVSNNAIYLKNIKAGQIPAEQEYLNKNQLINEYLMTTLRTQWGCDLDFIFQNYQLDLWNIEGEKLKAMISNGFIKQEKTVISLTGKGKLLADQIILELFLDDQVL